MTESSFKRTVAQAKPVILLVELYLPPQSKGLVVRRAIFGMSFENFRSVLDAMHFCKLLAIEDDLSVPGAAIEMKLKYLDDVIKASENSAAGMPQM